MPKCVLEFGIKGGRHVENLVLPTLTLGEETAIKVAFVLGFDNVWRHTFRVSRKEPRKGLENSTHFVSLTVLGAVSGPASANLWKPS